MKTFRNITRNIQVLCLAKSILTFSLSLLFSFPVFADTLHITHCMNGCPLGANSSNDTVARSIYALSFNHQTRLADWVAYRVTRDTVGVASLLSRDPLKDPVLNETLDISDYGVPGNSTEYEESEGELEEETLNLETGRFVPLASFAGTTYWRETNYISTMAPRSRDLGKGSWYGLEWAVRILAGRQGEVFVYTGPIFKHGISELKLDTEKSHRVPDGFYKIVATADGKVSAFIFEQQLPFYVHHCNQRVSLSEVEASVSLSFFPEKAVMNSGSLDSELGCTL